MAASRTTFEKLQRDRAKQAKAAAKRAKRLEKPEEAEDNTPVDVSTMGEEQLSAARNDGFSTKRLTLSHGPPPSSVSI